MTPQTEARRAALLDHAIMDKALDYRFDDNLQPRMTEDLKAAWEHAIEVWNSHADLIDRKIGRPAVRARLVRNGAMSTRFEPDDFSKLWLVMEMLDSLDAHEASKDPDLQPGIVRWMADFLFMSLIPEELIELAAHSKGHIYDRRLRHTKRAKARKLQAFLAEAQLVTEEARQEAEFQSLLRDVLRKDRKMRSDVRKDRNFSDFDFSTAPPNVKVVQLADRKSLMLVPPRHGRAKPPAKTE